MKNCRLWLIEWFSQRCELTSDFEKSDFFEQGLLDSFEMIEMIEEIESEFSITFDQDIFQDPRFVTVAGLCEIIKELSNSRQTFSTNN